MAYTYDVDGMRTSKTITSGTTTDTVEYVYEGGLLLQMRYNHMYFDFTYDANGAPVSMAYRMSPTATPTYYYYGLNSRGDVIALYNSSGNLLAKYTYDAYGKCLSVISAAGATISAKYAVPNLNPLRYRGYVYDNETGFYYLQSRYYDPTTCRFVNADGQLNTNTFTGHNQFAYCNNNPILMADSEGNMPFLVITAALGAVAGAVVGGYAAAKSGENIWAGIGIGAAAGALIGLGAGAATGVLLAGSATASVGAVAAGASTLVATVTTGGVGAGVSYVANNVLSAFNSSAPAVTQTVTSGKGFDTFAQLKQEIGSPGLGNEWHHIVEQCQINKSGFSPQMIHNTNNIIAIGKTAHRAISGYYSSIQPFTNGLRVRDWLAGQSFHAQYIFGLKVIELFK